MQWISSVFNKGIWKQNMRSVGWIGIVYFLVLFFSVPLQILMIATRDDNYGDYFFEQTESVFSVGQEFQLVIMFTVPVLLGIFAFRYMQVKLSADYMYGLPMKKWMLFHQQLIFGIVILLVPIVLNTISLYLIEGALNVNSPLFDHIMNWALSTFIITLFVFFVTVMAGMFTGISVLQGAFTYIVFLLPVGITTLFCMNISYFLDGFSVEYVLNQNMERLIIFFRAINLTYEPLTAFEFFVIFLLIVLCYLVSFIAHEKRPVEAATQAITFKLLRPVFWYGVTFCTMLVGGMYFAETQGRESYGWIIFGYVTAAVIGYYVATMILAKTWRVFRQYKGLVIYTVSMFVVAIVLLFDIFGYEKRLPNQEDIKQVYLGDREYFYHLNAQDSTEISPYYITYYKDTENIKRIFELHKAIIENRENVSNHRLSETVVIVYELENGKRFVREYDDVYLPDYEDLYRGLVESEEYKKNNNWLNTVEKTDLERISFYNYDGVNKMLTIEDEEKISELYDILKEEIDNQSYEETINENSWGSIEFSVKDHSSYYMMFKKSYRNLEKWLEDNGKLEKVITTVNDVRTIYIMKLGETLMVHDLYDRGFHLDIMNGKKDGTIKITEDSQIEEILRSGSPYGEGQYAVLIEFESGTSTINLMTEETIPAFLKTQLN